MTTRSSSSPKMMEAMLHDKTCLHETSRCGGESSSARTFGKRRYNKRTDEKLNG